VLIEHPAVAEAAVVPSPDATRLAVPKAYVVLAAGHEPSAETAASILGYAREHLAPYKRIRRIEFAELPKTISGKIRRVELRGRENDVHGVGSDAASRASAQEVLGGRPALPEGLIPGGLRLAGGVAAGDTTASGGRTPEWTLLRTHGAESEPRAQRQAFCPRWVLGAEGDGRDSRRLGRR